LRVRSHAFCDLHEAYLMKRPLVILSAGVVPSVVPVTELSVPLVSEPEGAVVVSVVFGAVVVGVVVVTTVVSGAVVTAPAVVPVSCPFFFVHDTAHSNNADIAAAPIISLMLLSVLFIRMTIPFVICAYPPHTVIWCASGYRQSFLPLYSASAKRSESALRADAGRLARRGFRLCSYYEPLAAL